MGKEIQIEAEAAKDPEIAAPTVGNRALPELFPLPILEREGTQLSLTDSDTPTHEIMPLHQQDLEKLLKVFDLLSPMYGLNDTELKKKCPPPSVTQIDEGPPHYDTARYDRLSFVEFEDAADELIELGYQVTTTPDDFIATLKNIATFLFKNPFLGEEVWEAPSTEEGKIKRALQVSLMFKRTDLFFQILVSLDAENPAMLKKILGSLRDLVEKHDKSPATPATTTRTQSQVATSVDPHLYIGAINTAVSLCNDKLTDETFDWLQQHAPYVIKGRLLRSHLFSDENLLSDSRTFCLNVLREFKTDLGESKRPPIQNVDGLLGIVNQNPLIFSANKLAGKSLTTEEKCHLISANSSQENTTKLLLYLMFLLSADLPDSTYHALFEFINKNFDIYIKEHLESNSLIKDYTHIMLIFLRKYLEFVSKSTSQQQIQVAVTLVSRVLKCKQLIENKYAMKAALELFKDYFEIAPSSTDSCLSFCKPSCLRNNTKVLFINLCIRELTDNIIAHIEEDIPPSRLLDPLYLKKTRAHHPILREILSPSQPFVRKFAQQNKAPALRFKFFSTMRRTMRAAAAPRVTATDMKLKDAQFTSSTQSART